MFDFIEKSVRNVFDMVDDTLSGEGPTKEQVSKLVADGISIAAIAAAFSVSVDVIEDLLDD